MAEISDLLTSLLSRFPQYQSLTKKIRAGPKITISGITEAAKAFFIQGLTPKILGSPVFWFVKDEKRAEEVFKQVLFWKSILRNKDYKVYLYPEDISQKENLIQRQKILYDILRENPVFVIIPIQTISQLLPDPKILQKNILSLKINQKIEPIKLIKRLIDFDYELQSQTVKSGTFSKRGGVIDIFPVNDDLPLKIEFIGNQIESISSFYPKTKKTKANLNSVQIIPIQIKPEYSRTSLLDYLPLKSLLILDNPEDLKENLKDLTSFPEQEFKKRTDNLRKLIFSSFPDYKTNLINLNFQSPTLYHRNLRKFVQDLGKLQKQGWQIIILTRYKKQIKKLFQDEKVSNKNIFFFDSKIDQTRLWGFSCPEIKFSFVSDKEIGLEVEKIYPKRKINTAFISELASSDFIVHIDHGIGKFIGTLKKELDGIIKEYLILEYADKDKLYLPIEYTDKISKYIGIKHPTIHRLHGVLWARVKQKVKENAQAMAKELLDIYAKRELSLGYAFLPDSPMQRELEESFEYQETEDQLKVLSEIKQDLEQPKPMDRLVCGDVGFGKTEIAIRCSFKACFSGKQVALLCPTTILAQQHYDTFVKRLKNFPATVEVLSRFKSKKQQKEIVAKLKTGEIDIIIGTHRLLSSDIQFKNLGLLIIDEEQRFGVKHKEKLKKLRAEVGILTLTATPIPRTLNLALSGLRDISTLETPPPGRLPIETFIQKYNEETIKKACEVELARKGQVYFLHNRVETIEPTAEKLKRLVPQAKVAVAHGQLEENKLAEVMHNFDIGKIDILVCSSIIENGLDLPNVNTLIVDNATKFGLANLYQLRGRIGRSLRQAYAYFFYHSLELKETARKRLEALLEAKELGSGFQLALRDLEIRGAGNILGKEQSGNIKAIGLNLYLRLLNQAVEELRTGKKAKPLIDVTVDLPISAYIPKGFILEEKKRLKIYQQMANINDLKQLNEFKKKFKTVLPKELENLFSILELKILAQKARIKSIDTINIRKAMSQKSQRFILKFAEKTDYQKIFKLLKYNHCWQIGEEEIKIDKENLGKEWLEELKKNIKILGK